MIHRLWISGVLLSAVGMGGASTPSRLTKPGPTTGCGYHLAHGWLASRCTFRSIFFKDFFSSLHGVFPSNQDPAM